MIKVILNIYDSKFGANPFRQDIEFEDNSGVVDIIDYIKAYEPNKTIKLSDFEKLVGMFAFGFSEDKTYNKGWNDCRERIIGDIKRFLKMNDDPDEPNKSIPKCLLCEKESTGAIFVVGDGEAAYACKKHETILSGL